MGGFNLNLGLPNQTPEPISGDSLTQYLRSLTNLTGQGGATLLNQGQGITQAGLGTVGSGTDQLNTAFGTTQNPAAYWQAILSGDPNALARFTAPTANALSNVYSGATNTVNTSAPAGGYRSATLSALPQAQASQVGNFLLSAQPTAAQNLNTLAQTQGTIGSSTVGAGLGTANVGTNTSNLGSNLLQQTLQALLARRGQNTATDTANMGFLTSGLESLVNAGSKAIPTSDIDLKEGIVPLGEVDGVRVYAWRYKDTGELAMGVIAQEVAQVVPEAVIRGRDGFLRVDYGRLFRTLRLAEAA